MDPGKSSVVAPAAALALTIMMMAVVGVGGDFAADQKECSEQLAGLATCLTYVQDGATVAAPTPDCCSGLKAVLQASRKCLCVLVKDKDDPNLGLKINVTRALGLPAICSAPANVSDCPRLLNLPPNSKEAQVFEQYAKQEQAAAQGASTAPGGGANAATAGAQKSGAPVTRWLGVGKIGGARAAVLSILFAAAPLLAAPAFLLLLG